MKNYLLPAIALLALGAGCAATTSTNTYTAIDFRDCAEHSGTVLESYPRQCRMGSQSFTEDIGTAIEHADLIQVESPLPNDTIASPVTITGEARGTWYFEASFPIDVLDADGNVIGNGHAEAQSNWMTEDFVPFTAVITFSTPATPTGTLVLRKDNPSGLPANDDELTVPIYF